MLSVSVVPSVSVESAMESNDVSLFKIAAFAATEALSLRTQALLIFSNISRLPVPRSVSSSSSASVFEMLRDSQILGSDRLKKIVHQKCAKTVLDVQLKA